MRKKVSFLVLVTWMVAICVAPSFAGAGASGVPQFVRFSGVLGAAHRSSVVPVTFAIYRDAGGGAPLWLESQNISVDDSGHYTALLGSVRALPADIFASNEARWLGVQVLANAEPEQPRVLLVSVPYALKAQDAETLGGRPLAQFVTQDSLDQRLSALTSSSAKTSTTAARLSAPATSVDVQGALFTDPTATNNYKWLELDPSQTSSPKFNGTLYNFPQPGDPTLDNWVMRLGYNILPGGAREDETRPALALEWESNYSPYTGQNAQEFHLAHIGTDGFVQRPITYFRPAIGTDSLSLNNSVLQLGDASANIKAFFGLGGQFDWYMAPNAPDNQKIFFLRTNRNSSLINDSSGNVSAITFQKLDANDYWQIGNAFTVSHATGNIGVASLPVSGVRMNVRPNATTDGIEMDAPAAPPNFFYRSRVGISNKFIVDGAGNLAVAGTVTSPLGFVGNLTGTASLAAAFATDPADCSAGTFATAIATDGDLTCAAITAANLPSLSSSYVDLVSSQTVAGSKTFSSPIVGSITGNAATATAFAANPLGCSTGFAVTIDAQGNLTCATIKTSDLPDLSAGYVDLASAQTISGAKTFSSPILGNLTGNASTATALAQNPADCSAGFAVSIDAQGNLTCATIQAADLPSLSGNYVDIGSAQSISGVKTFTSPIIGNLSGNATTANALALNPLDCTSGFAVSIDAQGNLTCATIQPADLPSLSGNYVDLTSAQSIAGNKTFSDAVTVNGTLSTGKSFSGQQTVAFSATPTFDAGAGNSFKITLNGNVTSSLLTNASAGQNLVLLLCQDSTGGRTFSWPANFKSPMTVGTQAGKCSIQQFYFDGTDAYSLTAGLINQ